MVKRKQRLNNTHKQPILSKHQTGFKQALIKPVLLILSIVGIFITISCKINSKYENYVVENIVPTGNENYLNENSEFIYNQDSLYTFELNLPLRSLKEIDSDPVAEAYVEGSLTFNGETISPVGIRYKGAIGAFYGGLSGKDWWAPSGRKKATKLSMKVKFNWNDSSKRFYNLKKLQFHSQNADASQMHERLGYWLFREMGVAAPRCVHAQLIINGVYQGVYALTEQIDEQFIAYNYSDSSGNLYKEIWPLNDLGQVTDENEFLEGLKTNKKQEFDASIIRSFAEDIVTAEGEDLQELIKKRMNLEQIISFAVVDRMIKNDDGPFHWYCGDDGCGNHNYYWYEEPSSRKVHLIPWDLDDAFTNIGYGKNSVTRIHNKWDDTSNDCDPFPSYAQGIYQKSAACDRLTQGWISFHQEYDSLKTVFRNGPYSEEVVNAKVDEWSAQIREATIEARKTHRDALKEKKWDEALINLKAELKHSRLNY